MVLGVVDDDGVGFNSGGSAQAGFDGVSGGEWTKVVCAHRKLGLG